MEILVRKYTAKPIFHPHYNSATDRYYYTKKDYLSDLKAKGLEPASKSMEHPIQPHHRPLTRWAREMANAIDLAKQPDGTVRVGSVFRDELKKRGVDLNPQVDSRLPEQYRR